MFLGIESRRLELEVAELFAKSRDGGIPVAKALVVPLSSPTYVDQDIDLIKSQHGHLKDLYLSDYCDNQSHSSTIDALRFIIML